MSDLQSTSAAVARSCGKRTASNLSLFLTGIVSARSAWFDLLGDVSWLRARPGFPLGPFTCPTTDWEATTTIGSQPASQQEEDPAHFS